jgi:hypothetical protein
MTDLGAKRLDRLLAGADSFLIGENHNGKPVRHELLQLGRNAEKKMTI